MHIAQNAFGKSVNKLLLSAKGGRPIQNLWCGYPYIRVGLVNGQTSENNRRPDLRT
jgi:hypothetical protein